MIYISKNVCTIQKFFFLSWFANNWWRSTIHGEEDKERRTLCHLFCTTMLIKDLFWMMLTLLLTLQCRCKLNLNAFNVPINQFPLFKLMEEIFLFEWTQGYLKEMGWELSMPDAGWYTFQYWKYFLKSVYFIIFTSPQYKISYRK